MKNLLIKSFLFLLLLFGFNTFTNAQIINYYYLVCNNNTSCTLKVEIFDNASPPNSLGSVIANPGTSNTSCNLGTGIASSFVISDNGGGSCNVTINAPWWVGGLPFSCGCTSGPSNWVTSSGTATCFGVGPPIVPNTTITVNAQ